MIVIGAVLLVAFIIFIAVMDQTKSTPRDFFLYLLATITLYVSVFNVINLVFALINYWLPDAANPYFDVAGSVRWPVAFLVIMFPVYFFVTRQLNREVAADNAKAEIKVRKWLMYLTIFLAALLLIGDLIALLLNFLNGELTLRFVLKILTVLIVGGGVFGYYLYDLRQGTGAPSANRRYFAWASIALVALAVIAGFYVSGSPFRQRDVKFDTQKIYDLQAIQGNVFSYWSNKNRLPANLDDLRSDVTGFIPPVDPQTGKPYEYRATGDLTFELCADFNQPSSQLNTPPYVKPSDPLQNWTHPAGHQCFARRVDPDLLRQPTTTPKPLPL